METKNNTQYETPTIEVVEIKVEKGFATSYGEQGAPGGPLDGGPTWNF